METLTIKVPEEKSSAVKAILKQFDVTIIDKTKSGTLDLSPEQEKEIISSQDQVKKGFYVEQSTLDDEINEWLKK